MKNLLILIYVERESFLKNIILIEFIAYFERAIEIHQSIVTFFGIKHHQWGR